MEMGSSHTGHSPLQLSISYSHKDERYRRKLDTHLAALRRQKLITDWHDRKITAGSEIDKVINEKLKSSDIVLLLVSPDFLNSDYCYGIEMEQAMNMHAACSAFVVPVILRPAYWADAPFGKLRALPKDGKPVVSWGNQDSAFLNVIEELKTLVTSSSFFQKSVSKNHVDFDYLGNQLSCFSGSVIQVGGIGSKLVTKAAWSENSQLTADNYISLNFNRGGDVMWVSCPDGYRIIEAKSWTGNQVFPLADTVDGTFGVGLENQLQNTIQITCEAK